MLNKLRNEQFGSEQQNNGFARDSAERTKRTKNRANSTLATPLNNTVQHNTAPAQTVELPDKSFNPCAHLRAHAENLSTNINTITGWPTLERPREKLAAAGAAALSDAELLAIFLRTGVAGQNAVDLGRTLLSRFGSLRALLSSPAANLKQVRGVGAAKIAQLHAIGELVQRSLLEELQQSTCFETPGAVRDYLRLFIGTRPYEVFACLYLDARYRLIDAKEVSRGTLTHTAVYPREIAKEALALNAAALIVAHNHPSGATEPSPADRQLTQQLHTTLELFDIKLLDHFIIASNAILSFSEQGWL